MAIVGEGFVREHSDALLVALRIVDVAIVVGSGWVAQWLSVGAAPDSRDQAFLAVVLGFSVALTFQRYGLYRPWRGVRVSSEVLAIGRVWCIAIGISALVVLLADRAVADGVTLALFVIWAVLGWSGISIVRVIIRKLLRWARSMGYNQRRILLLGHGPKTTRAVSQHKGALSAGYQVVGHVDDRESPRINPGPLKRLGAAADASSIVEDLDINEVWIGYAMAGEKRTEVALHALRDSMVAVRFLVDVNAFEVTSCTFSEVAGLPVLNIHLAPLDDKVGWFLKEVFDRTVALAILVVISPLMLTIAVGVKFSSPGPVLYRQKRVGWNNKPFMILKFRSMPVDAELGSGPVWARADDGRATRFGCFLRKSSLDELPQFLNVLRGEMSIVGPRPERPEFVEQFKEQIPFYMKKHMVKAGITGWAQVNGWRGETDLKRRIEHDLYYIQNWSIGLDLKIFMQTFVSGFMNKNAY
jgi:putative colanic acid biosynthesis UDP-glucose lipid carrier transferase